MAWNEPGGNKPKDPWGGGGNDGPPDLDEALKKFNEWLGGIFGGGGSGSGSNKPGKGVSAGVIGLVAIVLAGLWAASGFYQIDAQERGIVLRLGKYFDTVDSGLQWNPRLIDTVIKVNATAEPFRDPERGYRVFRKGTWQSPTGTLYGWRSWDAPKFMKERGVDDTFSPPELKNYPTQGTGGEIVQMVLGVLWRVFNRHNNWGGKAFLVNTVHDCIWFDLHPDVADEVLGVAKKVMESVPKLLEHYFDFDCPVPFPVDVEIGNNMMDLEHWHP